MNCELLWNRNYFQFIARFYSVSLFTHLFIKNKQLKLIVFINKLESIWMIYSNKELNWKKTVFHLFGSLHNIMDSYVNQMCGTNWSKIKQWPIPIKRMLYCPFITSAQLSCVWCLHSTKICLQWEFLTEKNSTYSWQQTNNHQWTSTASISNIIYAFIFRILTIL